jgi:hypothetical protein
MRLLFAAVLSLLSPAAAQANAPTAPARDCFVSSHWRGWSAPGDGDVLYLRVGLHEIYRAELTPHSNVHRLGGRFLVNKVRGSSLICSPLDLDLTLTDEHGFGQPLIVRALRRLTPAEIAAIPPADMPY